MSEAIVYDATCSFCRHQVSRIKKWNRGKNDFAYVPTQNEDLLERFPDLKQFEGVDSMRFVDQQGRAYISSDAVAQIAQRLPGWGWVGTLYKLPFIPQIGSVIYGWIAANRYRFQGKCEDGTCKF
jgi:predicted DCC family thiol-disulfide oxidoreductase YuxK